MEREGEGGRKGWVGGWGVGRDGGLSGMEGEGRVEGAMGSGMGELVG